MTRGKMRGRLEALEAQARARAADRLPLSDLSGFLFAVLSAVSKEAGEDVAAEVGRRVVEGQAARCHALLSGMSSGQLEDVARRMGLPVADLSALSAPELARLYFGGAA